ncbi:MAG TPA: hypothetical protein VET88_02460 [Gammaproteobacteria bacterium]|nr:hypothetical protein [Gammaproteobacteria bacterium]
MKLNTAPLLVYVLAISMGLLLYPVVAGAIADNRKPVDFGKELISDPGSLSVITEPKTSASENTGRQDEVSPAGRICWQDPASIVSFEYRAKGKSCNFPSSSQQHVSVQLGRGIGTKGEILGELDGVRVDYRLSDSLQLNGIAGYPVITPEDLFNVERQVFGVSFATNRSQRTWDLNGYLIEQRANGQESGKSTGGAIRYLKSGRSLLAYLDYDVAGNSAGTFMVSGAWRLPYNSTISATLDYRNRQMSGYQQKFLQQSMTATPGWNWILPDDRLANYIADGYREVTTLVFGMSHAFSQHIKLTGDFAVLEAMNDADAYPAATAASIEYLYHFKLTGKDLLLPGGMNKLDVRYNVTEDERTSTAAFDTRFAINQSWNIASNLRADYHRPVLERAPRWVASPTVKMEFRQTKQSSIKLEAGGEWISGLNDIAEEGRSSYFARLGYQAKF